MATDNKVEVRIYVDPSEVAVLDAIGMATGESRGEIVNRYIKDRNEKAVHMATLITNVVKSKGSVTAEVGQRLGK